MNANTTVVIHNVVLMALAGFTFYITGSAWAFAILIFLASTITITEKEDE